MKLFQKVISFLTQHPIKNILFIALLWVVINNFLFSLYHQTIIFADAENYYGAAVELYQKFRGHCYRPILFALISGLPLLFNAEKTTVFYWIIGLNLFFWFSSIVVLFKIISHFTTIKKAFILTLIFIFSLSNLFFVFHYLTESIFTLIFLLIIYNYILFTKHKKYKFLVFSITILIISVLIKPISTYLTILGFVLFIPIFLKNIKSKYNYFMYFSLLFITIQLIGMKAQFGNFTISYIDKFTIHNYLLSKSYNYKIGKEYDQLNNPRGNYLQNQHPKIQKKIAEEDIKNQLKYNKINILKAFSNNIYTNTLSSSAAIYFLENKNNFYFYENFKSFYLKITKIYNVIFIISFLFFLNWYIFIFKSKQNKIITLVSIFAFYLFFISGIASDQGDRLHIIIYPLILVCFSYLIENFKLKK